MRKISAIIIAKNEEEKIKDCLDSVKWVDEIIVIDNNSKDKTVKICRRYTNNIFHAPEKYSLKYAKLRDLGLKEATGDWVFYIDADERVTKPLEKEILSLNGKYQGYAIPRINEVLGKRLKYGGWYPDYVKRLFKKDKLKGWTKDLHEEPCLKGKIGHLENPLLHIKEKELSDMVEKTNKWSAIEAKLLFESGHPKMSWWRFIRIMLTEFWHRMIVKAAFMDKTEGVIYALYQVWSKFITYAKLWEMQINDQKK